MRVLVVYAHPSTDSFTHAILEQIVKGLDDSDHSYKVNDLYAAGFAYTLTREGWQGDLDGRVPLLSQEKALIVTPTFFTEQEYDKGWRDAMDTVLCNWGLRMAGVREARHAYFHAVVAADDATRRAYLDAAYRLGRDF